MIDWLSRCVGQSTATSVSYDSMSCACICKRPSRLKRVRTCNWVRSIDDEDFFQKRKSSFSS